MQIYQDLIIIFLQAISRCNSVTAALSFFPFFIFTFEHANLFLWEQRRIKISTAFCFHVHVAALHNSQLRECFEAFKRVRFQQIVRWMEKFFISFHHDSIPSQLLRKQFMFHRAVSHCLKLLEFMKGNKNQIHTWEKGGSRWWGGRRKPANEEMFYFFSGSTFFPFQRKTVAVSSDSAGEHIV